MEGGEKKNCNAASLRHDAWGALSQSSLAAKPGTTQASCLAMMRNSMDGGVGDGTWMLVGGRISDEAWWSRTGATHLVRGRSVLYSLPRALHLCGASPAVLHLLATLCTSYANAPAPVPLREKGVGVRDARVADGPTAHSRLARRPDN